MTAAQHQGSRGDLLRLLDSAAYVDSLNTALAQAGTTIVASDTHRPLGTGDDREFELPEFSRRFLDRRFDWRQIEEPIWWIVKRTPLVRTPTFDLISAATIDGVSGVLMVEAKAHHGELEACGKAFKSSSNPENHQKIGESIALANGALNAISPGFRLSRDAYYQISNRVAWGWRLASLGVPVTVLYLGFVGDPYWPNDAFETSEDWMEAARKYMAHVVPADALGRRLPCSAGGSLWIGAAALPAIS